MSLENQPLAALPGLWAPPAAGLNRLRAALFRIGPGYCAGETETYDAARRPRAHVSVLLASGGGLAARKNGRAARLMREQMGTAERDRRVRIGRRSA
jgi:hypothetical protein